MRLIFYFFPMLLLQYCFMASFAMVTVRNMTTDQYALLTFKAHVTDPQSVLTNNWSTSYPICSWIGISCGVRHYRVIALNLSYMGLGGTIPPHVGNLSFLVHLNFSFNNFHCHIQNEFSGSIPSWIGVLPELEILGLRNNSFASLIPNSLFNLSKLERLILGFNIIDGSIPSKFGKLSKLKELYLDDDKLQGTFRLFFICICIACLQNSFLINGAKNKKKFNFSLWY